MPIPVELLRFFDKFTPPSAAGDSKSAADSASMADFGDTAVAEAVAEAEIGGVPSAPIEIPDVPAIPELSPADKGDVGAARATTVTPRRTTTADTTAPAPNGTAPVADPSVDEAVTDPGA
jgi:hypothetical protein